MLATTSLKVRNGLAAASLLAAMLFAPVLAQAQLIARAMVTIKDAATDGPIEGATVTFVFKSTNYKEVRKTNKKGQVTFTLRDGPVPYEVSIEREGYNPATTTLQPVIGQVINPTYRLDPMNAAPATPTVDETAKLTPAQETFNAGVGLLQSEDLAGAQAKFEEALRLDPTLVAADSALAGIHLDNKDFAAAEASASKVVAAEPRNPRGHRLLYEALRGLNKGDAAEQELKVLLDLEKGGDVTAMLYNEGAEALRLGDTKTARERFEKVLELKPELEQVRSPLMVIYIKSKEFEKAATMAEQVLATKPNDVTAKRIRYDAYKGLGDAAKAKEAFDQLAVADPKVLIKGLYEDAQTAFNNSDSVAALALLDQINSIDPNVAKAWYLRGLCLVNLGKNTEGKAALEKFLALAPNDSQAGAARDMLKYLK